MENVTTWDLAGGPTAPAVRSNPAAAERHPPIERRENLSPAEFFSRYVAKSRPVVVPGALRHCPALSRWTFGHLRASRGQHPVKLKIGLSDSGVAGLRTVHAPLADYLDQLEAYEDRLRVDPATAAERPPYLHDVPLLSVLPEAADDLAGFPAAYFPAWYRPHWPKFAQLFLGPTHSLTPLHFDCLLTHNLFFQVAGRKRFILLHHDQLAHCYPYRWRWCEVDPEHPDPVRHPLYQAAQPMECVVEPGDLLYMPPGMLHHVRGLEAGISFNVDWHTPGSALCGVAALARGMPRRNAYYNAVIALGLCAGLPVPWLLPWYRPYLNYVS